MDELWRRVDANSRQLGAIDWRVSQLEQQQQTVTIEPEPTTERWRSVEPKTAKRVAVGGGLLAVLGVVAELAVQQYQVHQRQQQALQRAGTYERRIHDDDHHKEETDHDRRYRRHRRP